MNVSSQSSGLGRWLAVRIRALEPITLSVSVLPTLIAFAALAPINRWPADLAIVCVIGVAGLQATANMLNDYFDFRHGVDQHVGGEGRLSGWTLAGGHMTPPRLLREIAVTAGVAVACGAYLTWQRGLAAPAFALAGAAFLYAYTGPPFKLKHHGLGEPIIFAIFGPTLMIAAGYVLTGSLDWRPAALSVPIGLATTAILMANNIRDTDADRRAGIFTLAHVAGGKVIRALYVGCQVGAVLILAALGLAGVFPIALAACPLALLLLAGTLRVIATGGQRLDLVERTARYETVLLAYVLAVLLWARGFA